MPVDTFSQMADVQPGIPLDVSYQFLCHHNRVTLQLVKTYITTDKACSRSVSPRTFGS